MDQALHSVRALLVKARKAHFFQAGVRSGPSLRPDTVECMVFASPTVKPGETLFVQVFVLLPGQAAAAEAQAKQFDDAAEQRAAKTLEAEIPRGARVTFHLAVPGLEPDDAVQSLVWRGEPQAVQFGVRVPPDCPRGTYIGTVTVSLDSIPIGHIKFKIVVSVAVQENGPAPFGKEPVGASARHYRKAFISYASKDRTEVLKRVQMLSHFRIDYFQDLLDLEPGERWEKALYRHIDTSDLFLLFWSSAARDSEWVAQEWRYALERKGGDDCAPPEIHPVILEGPPPPDPPAELAHLHFNDYLLYFMAER